jgi:hypothetical protein
MTLPQKGLDWIAQPDSRTCQSACVGMVLGDRNIFDIRSQLEDLGEPGDPAVMGRYLRSRVSKYEFCSHASIAEMIAWLQLGERLITHGYFTGYGHVITLSGFEGQNFIADDPWGEFDAPSWTYTNNPHGNDLKYSFNLIYASCVASGSMQEAIASYRDHKMVLNQCNAWVHRIKL